MSEREPLLAAAHENERRTETSNLQDIENQFEDALQEEQPGTSFFDIIVRRPGTVIVALGLFALLYFATAWFSALKDPEVVSDLLEVPDITPLSAQLLEIRDHEICVAAQASIVMDYDKLGVGFKRGIAELAAKKLGSFALRVDDAVEVAAFVEEEDIWRHVIELRVLNMFDIDLHPSSYQELDLQAVLTEVGQTGTLGYVAKRLLTNKPVKFKAAGTAIASKYGLSFRVPFMLERDFKLPQQTSEDLAEISDVKVDASKLHSLNVTALMNATIDEFPVSGGLPELFWHVKIPGCDAEKLEVLCKGKTLPFELRGDDMIVNVLFSSVVDELPASLIEACDSTKENSLSPLDAWVRAYLAGETSTFYVQGVSQKGQPVIVGELLTGFEIPYTVNGKPPTEKLIQSVALEEVRFSSSSGTGASDTVRFNGKAIADVVLPSYLEMNAKSAIMVTGVMGNIQLFDESHNHFGQLLASEKWMQTISFAHEAGYEVVLFFDNLPLQITDNSVFADVTRSILLYGKATIRYDAVVDIRFDTSVGSLLIKQVRIKGKTEMRA